MPAVNESDYNWGYNDALYDIVAYIEENPNAHAQDILQYATKLRDEDTSCTKSEAGQKTQS